MSLIEDMILTFESVNVTHHYRTDFYNLDLDTAREDFQAGDQYLWLLRDAGTHLNLLNAGCKAAGNPDSVYWANHADTAKAYIIHVTREDEGRIEPITLERARSLAQSGIARGSHREPRRLMLWEVLNRFCEAQKRFPPLARQYATERNFQALRAHFTQAFAEGDESYILTDKATDSPAEYAVLHFKASGVTQRREENPALFQGVITGSAILYRIRHTSHRGHAKSSHVSPAHLRNRIARARGTVARSA